MADELSYRSIFIVQIQAFSMHLIADPTHYGEHGDNEEIATEP